MKEYRLIIAAAVIAFVLALYLVVRVSMQKRSFDHIVFQSLQTSEGYDQKLIEMVTGLEEELATRASFGYKGGKDPMTGKTRLVVVPSTKSAVPTIRRPRGGGVASAAPKEAVAAPVEVDAVRLTAIIFDDVARLYTAIVMDGERSLSVTVGDRVSGRVVSKITAESVFMESNTERFKYDIYGNTEAQSK
jgi:hypothetical protein